MLAEDAPMVPIEAIFLSAENEDVNKINEERFELQGVSKKYRKAEYVQRRVCFVNVQSSLHLNVIFSLCARMGNAACIIFIMWNSISGLEAWYHLWFNISCCVSVTVRSHKEKIKVIF